MKLRDPGPPAAATPGPLQQAVLAPADFNLLAVGDSICKRPVSRGALRSRFARRAAATQPKPGHKYRLKQGAPSKLFLKNSQDPGLLDVLDQFNHFERRHNSLKQARLQHLGVVVLWKLENLPRACAPEPASPRRPEQPGALRRQSTLAEAVASASPKFKRPRHGPSSQPQLCDAESASSSLRVQREPRLEKKRSEVLEQAGAGPKPRRKCISFHNGAGEAAKERLSRKFKILRWESVSECEEQVIVVFNECVTIDLQLLKNERTERWAVGRTDSRIFSSDCNLHALLGACIDYVSEEYPGLDLLGFLAVLFVVHHDVSGFYKLCRARFPRIRVDRQGLMRVSGETGVHLRVDLFTDRIDIRLHPPGRPEASADHPLAPETHTSAREWPRPAFPRVLALPRTATDAPHFAPTRSGEPFSPSLLELIEAQLAFAEAVHGKHPGQQSRPASCAVAGRSVTLEIGPKIMRRRRTPGSD